jgi:hypothetical protein
MAAPFNIRFHFLSAIELNFKGGDSPKEKLGKRNAKRGEDYYIHLLLVIFAGMKITKAAVMNGEIVC